jgi:23S rRNA (pseudouridine1915-N3)-methyltransferase
MRLTIAAVGRLKNGAERDLLDKYRDRFHGSARRLGLGPVVWHEIGESRAGDGAKRRDEEGAALLKVAQQADFLIALDERGKGLTSLAFARVLAKNRDSGKRAAAILIGGPDGFAESVREAAHLQLSFGAITLPHGLVRIVLAEQLYRAATILSGHPYHRA